MPRLRLAAVASLLVFAVPDDTFADRLEAPGGPTFKSVKVDSPIQVGDEVATFNGYVYFAADDNGGTGNELWRTDGTGAGTTRVTDLNPGAGNANPRALTIAGDRMYFNANPGDATFGVFYIDAAAPGAVKTAKALTAPHNGGQPQVVDAKGTIFDAVNGKALLQRLQGENQNANYALYVLGDTGDTFTKISTGLESVAITNVFRPSATVGGWTYVARANANASPGQGAEPYRTDGSVFEPVKDLNPGQNGNAGSNPTAFVATANRAYFVANDGSNGSELWVTDPADKDDTHMIDKHHPGPDGTSINDPGQVANGDVLYYVPSNDPVTGPEVWRTDGTDAGTYVVRDITPGTGGVSVPVPFAFRSGIGLLRGGEVFYSSDGTPGGTAGPLHAADNDGYGLNSPVATPDQAYFVGGASPFGQVVWRSDGTAGGTFPLSAGGFDGTPAGNGCTCAQMLGTLGSRVLFFSRNPDTKENGYVKLFALDRSQPDELRAATAPPVITTALGGTRLDVSQGTWSGRPTAFAYQWLRNGQPIAGDAAQRNSYVPPAADAGQTFTARVTTTGIGAPRFASADSEPFVFGPGPSPGPGASPSPSPARTLSLTRKAKLKGRAKVGRRLRLRLPRTAQAGVRITIRWYANGKRIRKQAKPSLRLTRRLKGKRISARITLKKAGYKTLTVKVGPTRKVT